LSPLSEIGTVDLLDGVGTTITLNFKEIALRNIFRALSVLESSGYAL
jgi:hypothetical protein